MREYVQLLQPTAIANRLGPTPCIGPDVHHIWLMVRAIFAYLKISNVSGCKLVIYGPYFNGLRNMSEPLLVGTTSTG